MIRYYILPVEVTDYGATQPKYIENYPADQPCRIAGLFPIRNRYIIKINSENQSVFDYFEAQPDVLRLTRTRVLNNLDRLEQAGMDITGIDASTTAAELESRIIEFFTGRNETLDVAFAGRAT